MSVFASAAGERATQGLAPLVLALLIGAALLYPFRRRIGGSGGGAEKAIVGVIWVVAALVIAVLAAT